MRALAIILAIAFVIGAGLYLPGGVRHRIDHQVSVQTTAVPTPAPEAGH